MTMEGRRTNTKKIALTLLFFFLAGLCEIGGGYLVWLWLRDNMSWMIGALGGFVLFLYGVVPTFQPSHFHRIYAAYGGIFIVMAVFWGWIFEGIAPDRFDVVGARDSSDWCSNYFLYAKKGRKREGGESSLVEVVTQAPPVSLALFFVVAPCRDRRWLSCVAMATRKENYSTRCIRWNYPLCLWNNSNVTASRVW